MNDLRYLKSKGFCVIENLLDQDLIQDLIQDYNLILDGFDFPNKIYPIMPAGKKMPVKDKIDNIINPICKEIAEQANITTNFSATPIYFSIPLGIQFSWHQDHESFFQTANHSDYLNIYIPFVKPDAELSNVCVIDFEKLLEIDPSCKNLIGYGATRITPQENQTIITDDNTDIEYTLPFNIEQAMYIPKLKVGDALIMRGDCIHRTQDTSTPRISISIRCMNTETVIHKSLFDITCKAKQYAKDNNPEPYERLLQKYNGREQMTLGEMLNVYPQR